MSRMPHKPALGSTGGKRRFSASMNTQPEVRPFPKMRASVICSTGTDGTSIALSTQSTSPVASSRCCTSVTAHAMRSRRMTGNEPVRLGLIALADMPECRYRRHWWRSDVGSRAAMRSSGTKRLDLPTSASSNRRVQRPLEQGECPADRLQEQRRIVARPLVAQECVRGIHLVPLVPRADFLQPRADRLPPCAWDVRVLAAPDEQGLGLQLGHAREAVVRLPRAKRP